MWPGASAQKFGATGYDVTGGGNMIAIFDNPVNGAAGSSTVWPTTTLASRDAQRQQDRVDRDTRQRMDEACRMQQRQRATNPTHGASCWA
jgi:hypothetical protein